MRLAAVGALLATVALALYGDSLGGWFLADDFAFVERVHLQWTREPWQFLSMFVAPPADPEPGGFHRPLSLLSWGLQYLAFGINPIGYRITNLLIHVGCGLLIFRLAWRWTGGRQDISWLAALLFLVCPLHTESVAWIAARDDTLALLFFLAVLNVVPVTGASGMTLGIVVTLCALWCKESALMLPPVVTAYYLLVAAAARPPKEWIRRAIKGSLWIWIVTVCYLADRYWVLGKFGGTYPGYDPPDYLTLEYIQTRLNYWVLLFSPLEGETFPTWLRWTAGLGTLALVVSSFADRSLKRGIVLLLACWTLLAPMPYLWANIDPHDLQNGRHLYACYAPFCILLAIGTTHVAQRFLPASRATRGLAFGTLLVLLSCATWLTKEAHVRAAVLSRKLTDEIYKVMAREQARPEAERPHRLVLQNLPPIYKGAHLASNMAGMSRPPFHEPVPFEVEVLDSGFFPLFIVSYLKEARDQGKRVIRYMWTADSERFTRKPTLTGSATLRGVIERTSADSFRLRQHDIRLTAADDHVAAKLRKLAGANVELVGRVLPPEPDISSRPIQVTTLHKVERILEVPESVVRGNDLVVQLHGRPGSYYVLFEPNLAGFLPLHEFGTFLVDTNVEAFTRGRVPRSGVAVHRIPVPAKVTPTDQTLYYQALMTRQDERDRRLFVLTACRGFVVRPRRP
ncbi:MAG: hypothetical protein ACYTKC_01420 [Planctomycetota bacterium]|jgi:hypothetical protein